MVQRTAMAPVGRVVLLALAAMRTSALYVFDDSWSPDFPPGCHQFSAVAVARSASEARLFVSQRGNTSIPPVLVVSPEGKLLSTWGSEMVAKDPGPPATWGSHGIAADVPRGAQDLRKARVWINDFTNCTLSAYDVDGKQRLLQAGMPGKCGTPSLFGKDADTAFLPLGNSRTAVFVGDGDGSTLNRVVRLDVGEDDRFSVRWTTDGAYNNPHSVTVHERSGLVIIADRDHNHTRLLRTSDGKDLGSWDCGLAFGPHGKPFGVRTSPRPGGPKRPDGRDLVFVAVMDNPQDGKNQKIVVLDASGLDASDGAKSKCRVLQEIPVGPPSRFSGPHLLEVDDATGDVYTALVSDKPRSAVLRYRLVTGPEIVV